MSLRGLYAITPERPRPDLPLVDQVEQAILGGARVVQYRDKSADPVKRRTEAAQLLQCCRAHGVPLLINDDVELAAEIGADGVHLGRHDAEFSAAREQLGPNTLIGLSCYNQPALAERARDLGADYLAFGRFFPSASKPDAVQADLALLRLARQSLGLPLVAIGGISPQNGGPLIQAGADMLAVIDAVFGREDIRAAAQEFTQLFGTEDPR